MLQFIVMIILSVCAYGICARGRQEGRSSAPREEERRASPGFSRSIGNYALFDYSSPPLESGDYCLVLRGIFGWQICGTGVVFER